ncbi:MAG: hypothetical protein ACI9UD_003129 [Glaciecola sp.]|jgi:hypothetical protein
MLTALPQNMEHSSIMMFLLCHASVTAPAKSKSLWLVKSSNITVCPIASSGGVLVLLPVFAQSLLAMSCPLHVKAYHIGYLLDL